MLLLVHHVLDLIRKLLLALALLLRVLWVASIAGVLGGVLCRRLCKLVLANNPSPHSFTPSKGKEATYYQADPRR